jgi:hypothetical protein
MILLSALVSATLVVSGFMFKYIIRTNERLIVIEKSLADIQKDTSLDEGQQRQLSHQWKLHQWTRDQINELRVKNGMQLAKWPESQ